MAIGEDDISQEQEGSTFLQSIGIRSVRSKPHDRFYNGFHVEGAGKRKYGELNCTKKEDAGGTRAGSSEIAFLSSNLLHSVKDAFHFADSGGICGKGKANEPAAMMESDEEQSPSILQRRKNRREARPKKVKAGAVERETVNLDDSFDRLPGKEDDVKGRVKVVTSPVRKKVNRRPLKAFDCPQCKKFYESVTPEERGRLMAQCSRHRALHAPPAHSPQDFYQISYFYQDEKAQEAEKPSPLRLRKRRKKDADASFY
jgi:hypothetical protein